MYNNCAKIPIYNFFELIKTKDFKLLLEDGESIDDYKDDYLMSVMIDILTEYNALTNNKKLMQEYTQKLNIEYLEAKYNISKEIISLYHENPEIDFLIALKEFGWIIDLNGDIKKQLDRILKNLIGLKNKINIRKSNFVKKFRKQNNETTPNFDIERAVINLEVGIPLSYKIDIYKDSIKKYIYWVESLENKNKALERNG